MESVRERERLHPTGGEWGGSWKPKTFLFSDRTQQQQQPLKQQQQQRERESQAMPFRVQRTHSRVCSSSKSCRSLSNFFLSFLLLVFLPFCAFLLFQDTPLLKEKAAAVRFLEKATLKRNFLSLQVLTIFVKMNRRIDSYQKFQ